ncbi:hypothetical protein CLV67_13714 [Actinoplanes italicus]|uniref:Uncharacterized protein n=1 Tax=Actinoplanes italicus TaxID=113567 RepID=A0A2T0JP02_9ACTN|nr:hypothetical protein CLV67_13714 [Actinoplanes italicus]
MIRHRIAEVTAQMTHPVTVLAHVVEGHYPIRAT